MSTKTVSSTPQWLLYIICYIAWFAIAAAGVWLLLQLRLNLIDISMAIDVGPWALGAIDKFGIVLLGLAWVVGVFAAEGYLRKGVELGQLWPRLGRVAGIEAGLLVASYGLQWIMLYVG